jgi:hypothetical protein
LFVRRLLWIRCPDREWTQLVKEKKP